ncbi:MAG TPA: PIN domain-containing protein [Thermosulfidibacter takaii]|uniref:PIN domain-containing protein n=1 Tax=Thermosulfidibacter takaii TaxID=412593 RepID=A0A7C0U712_9BACT|nr:PIN domain-containing protein [Thermosulfidibacter takaii]
MPEPRRRHHRRNNEGDKRRKVIYSIDTSVLLDILIPDPYFGHSSKETLKRASAEGKLVICPVVYAELSAFFRPKAELEAFLTKTGIKLSPFKKDHLWMAGKMWKDYLAGGGKRKNRILADFLIGGFSKTEADAIITRDAAFYSDTFNTKVYYLKKDSE